MVKNSSFQRRVETGLLVVIIALFMSMMGENLKRTEDRYSGAEAAADRAELWAAVCALQSQPDPRHCD